MPALLLGPGIALAQAQPQEAPSPLDGAEFARCLGQLKASADFKAIQPATFARYTDGLAPDPTVLPLLNRQPEFTLPPWDYLAMLVDDERVADGRAAMTRWSKELQQIEQTTGVPAAIVAGVWGVESNFGQNLGGRPLVTSLATLSCFGRRQSYFRGEFAAARDDQIRRRVGKIAETEEGLADPADLTRLEDLARAAADSGDPALLGRHYWFASSELQLPLDVLIRLAVASSVEGIVGLDFGGVADDIGDLWDRRALDVALGSNFVLGPLVLRLHFARAIDIGAPLPVTANPWVTNFSLSWLGG